MTKISSNLCSTLVIDHYLLHDANNSLQNFIKSSNKNPLYNLKNQVLHTFLLSFYSCLCLLTFMLLVLEKIIKIKANFPHALEFETSTIENFMIQYLHLFFPISNFQWCIKYDKRGDEITYPISCLVNNGIR